MIHILKGRAHTMADQIKMRKKTHLYFTPKIAKAKVLIKRKCLFWVIFGQIILHFLIVPKVKVISNYCLSLTQDS